MPTKLKKPITVTFTHVENAVCHFLFAHSESVEAHTLLHPNMMSIATKAYPREAATQIESGLRENGIEPLTWLPPQPFKIAGRECEFNADGTVKLSCGTLISNAEIEDFLKRRAEIKQEWPKYFRSTSSHQVYRATNPEDIGSCFAQTFGWELTHGETMVNHVERNPNYFKPITRDEAIAIVGAENIDK